MLKLCHQCRGAISVLLVLIMLPMFIFAGLCVDGTRVTAAKSNVSGAGDLAINAALSEYDDDLHDIYGVFAVSKSMDDLQKNVTKYFENTINGSEALQGTDSYTRNFIDSVVSSIFSGEEMDFNNIIDTQLEDDSFQLSAVKESSIARPQVFKRQLVEYMKFRGPVNLGKGMLTKLGVLGDGAKQSKALQSKLDYEEKLDDVGDSCEQAYKAIKKYNQDVQGTIYEQGDIKNRYNNSVKSTFDHFTQMTQYIVVYLNTDMEDTTVKIDLGYRNDVRSRLNNLSGKDRLDELETILREEDYIKFTRRSEVVSSSEVGLEKKIIKLDDADTSSFQQQFDYVVEVIDNYQDYNRLYTLYQMYDECYKDFKKTDEYGELSEEEQDVYKDIDSIIAKYADKEDSSCSIVEHVDKATEFRKNWKEDKASEKGNAGRVELYQWLSPLSVFIGDLDTAINKLKNVLSEIDDLQVKRGAWDASIQELKDGTVKTTMKGDFEGSAKALNRDAVNALIADLEKNKSFYEQLKGHVEQNTYYEKQIATDVSGGSYYEQYYSFMESGERHSFGEVESCADTYIVDHYIASNCTEESDGIGQIKSGQFFEYLERIYGGVHSDESDAEKSEAKAKKKAIIKAGNKGTEKDVEVAEVAEAGTSIQDKIGIQADLNEVLQDKSEGGDEGNLQGVDADGDNKKVSKNLKDNLGNVASVLSNLEKILENARDNLYIEEYVTEVFSCYTSPYTAKNGQVVSQLNKKNFLDNHQFYRSEVEYILFHKSTPEENLKAAKASIFAIRFLLNSLYAFSAADLRGYTLSVATAIAGWTGFGVPIVQSLLTLSLAMGESLVDINALLEGKDVALYKTQDTWTLSASGLAQKVSGELETTITNAVAKQVTDVFDKIENTAYDQMDSINSSVTEYTEQTTKSIRDSITASIVNPLSKKMLDLIGSSYSLDDGEIAGRIDEVLNAVEQSAVGTGVMGEITQEAVELVRNTYKMQLVTLVKEQYENYKSMGQSAVESITNAINKKMETITKQVNNKVVSMANSANDKLKSEVSTILAKGEEAVQSTAKQEISRAIEKYNCQLAGTTANDNGTEVDKSKDKTGLAGGITMNYKEYLKIFALISTMANQNGVLSRTIEMIQTNVAKTNADFNIAKSYTMIQASATISIKTSFMDVVTTNGNAIELDYSNIGTGRQKIKYTGINGY